MTISQLFAKLFGPVERTAETVVHLAEKELEMIPQDVIDAIARIKAVFEGKAADAAAIASLNTELTACKTLDASKDAQVAALTQELSDTKAQLAEVEAAIVAAANGAPAPAPAPAPTANPSGTTSPDVTP